MVEVLNNFQVLVKGELPIKVVHSRICQETIPHTEHNSTPTINVHTEMLA
jgi:hypothetical protein